MEGRQRCCSNCVGGVGVVEGVLFCRCMFCVCVRCTRAFLCLIIAIFVCNNKRTQMSTKNKRDCYRWHHSLSLSFPLHTHTQTNNTLLIKLQFIRPHWSCQRHHRLLVHVSRHRFAHIIRILIPRIILQYSAVHTIPKATIHVDRHAVADAHKQVHKIRVMHLVCDLLEHQHQFLSELLAPKIWGDGDGGDVTVPAGACAFCFA